MNIKDPAADIAAALDGKTLGGVVLAADANLFAGQFFPLPQLAVYFLASGGPGPTPYLHSTASAVIEVDVQCLVRGAPGKAGYAQAWALARGMFGELQQNAPAGYVSLLAQGAPTYVPDPDTGGYLISMNFRARYVA